MPSLPERIAQTALQCFEELPAKCKPRTHQDGRREWTPLSAVVAVSGDHVECLSLGTGTKCLPASALPRCRGSVLHDSHAEVLALRGFNRWLLTELDHVLLNPSYESMYIRRIEGEALYAKKNESLMAFTFTDDVSFHFFTTEAPCGDASMELLIKSKSSVDTFPWAIPSSTSLGEQTAPLLGRGYFSRLGVIRRKPSRGDAEATLSKSCTDKLALKQFTSLLAFPADVFVCQTTNSFIQSVVVYEDQYDLVGYERAFGSTGRLASVASEYAHFFDTRTLPSSFRKFPFGKDPSDPSQKASNISALWIRGASQSSRHIIESLLNGVKQGYKQFEERSDKESVVCRSRMWLLGRRVGTLIVRSQTQPLRDPTLVQSIQEWLRAETYHRAKAHTARQFKKKTVAQRLAGWVPNRGDEDWSLGVGLYGDMHVRGNESSRRVSDHQGDASTDGLSALARQRQLGG